jgi:flagellar hook-associated protein 3 FlgL
MKAGTVSTLSMGQAARSGIAEAQRNLGIAERELASGRHADLGIAQGHRAGQVMALRREHDRLAAISGANAVATLRLDVSQDVLGRVAEQAQSMLATLLVGRTEGATRRIIVEEARAAFEGLTGNLNTAVNGAHIFAGVNTDARPLESYFASPVTAARTAVHASFEATFGFPSGSPLASSLTPAQVTAYVDGAFAAEFAPANWEANWSSASDRNVRSRINSSALVETSANANEAAFRELAQIYIALAEIGDSPISDAAFDEVARGAVVKLGTAIRGVADIQGRLGVTQQRIEQADRLLEKQRDLITGGISDLEDVDPFEASVRATQLITQLEVTYALTARLQRLSLLNSL